MSNTDYNAVIEKMVAAIVDRVYKEDSSDHSFKARISEVVGSKKYKVTYHGDVYNCTSPKTLNVGDWVWVCAPCNNWNNLFIVAEV